MQTLDEIYRFCRTNPGSFSRPYFDPPEVMEYGMDREGMTSFYATAMKWERRNGVKVDEILWRLGRTRFMSYTKRLNFIMDKLEELWTN